MHSSDSHISDIKKPALASQTFSTAGVSAGNVYDITDVETITIFNEISSHTDGSFSVQDVQFSSVSNFASDVETFDITKDDYFLKNDRTPNSADALVQTIIAAVGQRKISLPNLSKNGKKFFRARFLRTVGTSAVNFVGNADYLFRYSKIPVIQS